MSAAGGPPLGLGPPGSRGFEGGTLPQSSASRRAQRSASSCQDFSQWVNAVVRFRAGNERGRWRAEGILSGIERDRATIASGWQLATPSRMAGGRGGRQVPGSKLSWQHSCALPGGWVGIEVVIWRCLAELGDRCRRHRWTSFAGRAGSPWTLGTPDAQRGRAAG